MASLATRFQLAARALFSKASENQARTAIASFEGNSKRAPILGTKELLDGYSTMPWLRAAAGRVSDAVGTTEWQLFAPGRRRSEEDHEQLPRSLGSLRTVSESRVRRRELNRSKALGFVREISSHPLLDLLFSGNEFMPGQQVMKVTQIHMDLAGEAFWLLERDALQVPRFIYPLVPTWVQSLPTRKNPTYKVQIGGFAEDVPVTEIIRFHDPNPSDPFGRGSGLAKTLADELQTDEFAAQLTKLRFINSGRPDLIVSADDLEPNEVTRLEENWINKTTGFFNKFRPFFAARKLDVKIISQSFADMQVMELRQHERNTIIQTWGMPPEMLGILTASNRATIHSADYIFSAWVVEPRLENIRRTLQFRLVPMYDGRLHLDFVSPINEDKEFELLVMKTAPRAFRIDEFRALAGQPALPGAKGQELYNPGTVSGSRRPASDDGLPSLDVDDDKDLLEDGFRNKRLLT